MENKKQEEILEKNKNKFLESVLKALKQLGSSIPIMLGIILLISLLNSWIPKESYSYLFTGNYLTDPLVGGILGSILAGNPITSYILGGELLNQGISLVAVTAFIVAWVTVGLVQLPAETKLLGKKFAVTRNISAFLFSIIVAILTVIGVGLF